MEIDLHYTILKEGLEMSKKEITGLIKKKLFFLEQLEKEIGFDNPDKVNQSKLKRIEKEKDLVGKLFGFAKSNDDLIEHLESTLFLQQITVQQLEYYNHIQANNIENLLKKAYG